MLTILQCTGQLPQQRIICSKMLILPQHTGPGLSQPVKELLWLMQAKVVGAKSGLPLMGQYTSMAFPCQRGQSYHLKLDQNFRWQPGYMKPPHLGALWAQSTDPCQVMPVSPKLFFSTRLHLLTFMVTQTPTPPLPCNQPNTPAPPCSENYHHLYKGRQWQALGAEGRTLAGKEQKGAF